MNTKNDTHTAPNEVLIAGGGLVGFSLALSLAKNGIKSTLLEARRFPDTDDPSKAPDAELDTKSATEKSTSYIDLDSRNTALSRRSVGIYQDFGLWHSLQSHATPVLEVQISERGSFGKARLRASEEKVESFGQVMENRWLGHKLLETARQHKHITLIDDAQITKLQQDDTTVTLSYTKDKHTHQLTSSLLVAADGQHSFCRQALGITVDAKDYAQTAVVAVVETDKPHQNTAFERFGEHGPLALLPLAGKTASDQSRRSVVWITPKDTEAQYLGADNDTHFLKALQDAFGGRAGTFLRVGRRGAYPLSQVLAERQVVGRTVILGNAAHTLHPVAGQGFNLCLRDAAVFTDYMVQHLKLHGDFASAAQLSGTLTAYEQARLTDQKRVTKFCDGVVRGFTHKNTLVKWSRNFGLLAFDTLPGAKQLVANYAMGLKA